MRRKSCGIISVILLTGIFTCQCFAIETSAASAILVEQKSGRVFYEKAADEEMLIASITKIMTAVVALENGELGMTYTVTGEDMAEGSSMYLKPGEVLSLEELLYGLMLSSGNDAALAVAHCVSGDVREFVASMNETAAKLGMTHSSFANPNGLDQEGHYSTARDMALLTSYALNNEHFRRIVSTESVTIGDRYLKNHNKLLALCEGCIGIKTGYTKAAGRTLVSAAERQGMTFICVTLNDGDDWNDHQKLYDDVFSRYHLERPVEAGCVMVSTEVIGGTQARVNLVPAADFTFPVKDGEKLTVKVDVPILILAPLEDGETVGSVSVYLDGSKIGAVPLVVSSNVEAERSDDDLGFLKRLFCWK